MKNKFKINKKIFLITLSITTLAITNLVFAEEIKESLELYLELNDFDFMGKEFEEVLFNVLENISQNELQVLWNDIKTMPIQLKCIDKVVSDNSFIYAPISFLSILKATLPAKAFKTIMLKVARVILK